MKNFLVEHPIISLLIAGDVCFTIRYIAQAIANSRSNVVQNTESQQ